MILLNQLIFIDMFYHVTKQDHGFLFKFKPKLPETALISKEGDILRVCVCPTIFYCLRAITSNHELLISDLVFNLINKPSILSSLVIYGTSDKPNLPPAASDFRRNKEHWFLKPITMERLGFLDLRQLAVGSLKITHLNEKIKFTEFKNLINSDRIRYQKTKLPT